MMKSSRATRVLKVLFEELTSDGHLQLVEGVLHHVVGVQVVYRVEQMIHAWYRREEERRGTRG